MDEQDNGPMERTYSDAQSAADLLAYQANKRWLPIRSLAVVLLAGAASFAWFHIPSAALVVGGACGVINARLTMRSGERLLERRNAGFFVISSFLRIAVFGIVPVAFAAIGPWWAMLWYFVGFFVPLVLFAIGATHVEKA